MKRLSMLLGLAALGLLMVPSAALAHAELASSNPADKASVQTMPAQVSLTLSEPVQKPSRVAVTSPEGIRVNSYDVTVRDDTVTTAINQPTPAGTYTITYEIVSADEHTVSGTLTFDVAEGSAPAPASTAPATPAPTAAAAEVPEGGSSGAAAGPPAIAPATGGSSTAKDALTIVGFSIVAMAGLVLLLRAGLKSAGNEDDD